MSASVRRAASVLALVVPLVLAVGQSPAGAHDYPAENDCSGSFGAVTSQPGPNYGCYGIDNGYGPGYGGGYGYGGYGGYGFGDGYGDGPWDYGYGGYGCEYC